jgi:Protein of unknown function (DUF3455)
MSTTTRLSHFVFAVAAVVAICGLIVTTSSAQPVPADPLDPRTYAPQSKRFLTVYAVGVQKYRCQADGTWLFTDPEAALYRTPHTRKPIGTHFLNFATGRPVWQLKDGSSVEAARHAAAPGGAGNIPWLLLQSKVTTAGAEGDRLTDTTWVQRLSTSGGVAPAGACTPGDTDAVPYTADYVFWKAKAGGGDESGD